MNVIMVMNICNHSLIFSKMQFYTCLHLDI
nr:MAG TPA: hypothetical protein [Bacteriophage sp.]